MTFRFFRPYQDELPIVFSFSHSGNVIPARATMSEEEQIGSSGLDILLNSSSYGVSVFRPIYSRHWVDLCESPEIIRGKKIECAAVPFATPLEKTINRNTKNDLRLLRSRIKKYHRAYCEAVEARIADLKLRFPNVLLIDLHVLPSKNSRSSFHITSPLHGQISGDIHSIVQSMLEDGEKLVSSTMPPVVGGFLLDYFGDTSSGTHVLQIAFSKKLVEENKMVNDFGELKLQRIMRELAFVVTGALKVSAKA